MLHALLKNPKRNIENWKAVLNSDCGFNFALSKIRRESIFLISLPFLVSDFDLTPKRAHFLSSACLKLQVFGYMQLLLGCYNTHSWFFSSFKFFLSVFSLLPTTFFAIVQCNKMESNETCKTLAESWLFCFAFSFLSTPNYVKSYFFLRFPDVFVAFGMAWIEKFKYKV